MKRSPQYVSPGHLDWIVLPPTRVRRLVLVITYAGHCHVVRFTNRRGAELRQWFEDQWHDRSSSLRGVNLEPIWERLARGFEAVEGKRP